jgi:alkylated DNA nucleotide flippase Atl1
LRQRADRAIGGRIRGDTISYWASSHRSTAVLEATAGIPRGEVRPYAWVARLAGTPQRCARPAPPRPQPRAFIVPCHRVVKSDFDLGQYSAGGTHVKSASFASRASIPHAWRSSGRAASVTWATQAPRSACRAAGEPGSPRTTLARSTPRRRRAPPATSPAPTAARREPTPAATPPSPFPPRRDSTR